MSGEVEIFLKKGKEEKEKYPTDEYMLCVAFVALRNVKVCLLALGKLILLQYAWLKDNSLQKNSCGFFKLQAN